MPYHITHELIEVAAQELAEQIYRMFPPASKIRCYGIPRGGVSAAYAVAGRLPSLPGSFPILEMVDVPELAQVFIDDLIDSGATRDRYAASYPETPFLALFDKADDPRWYVFPWETTDTESSAEDIPVRLLQYVGEDEKRGGLTETPKRFLKAWDTFTSGYNVDPADILKAFEDGAENYNEMVLVKSIPVYSQCEHHLVPFFGVAHVAYIPRGKIVGLSKLSRVVDVFARRLQVQERLTNQIATALEDNLKPKGVAVVLECRHLCMEARGISQQGHTTVTSAMRGAFMNSENTRSEFMQLIK